MTRAIPQQSTPSTTFPTLKEIEKHSPDTNNAPITTMSSVPLPIQNFVSGDPLSLDRIRAILVRLEDTIIFSLIERAQFAHNPKAYRRGAIPELKEIGFEGSWLEWFLKETETFHCECTSRLCFICHAGGLWGATAS